MAALLCMAACRPEPGDTPPPSPTDSLSLADPHQRWADSVMATLTQEERIGQLILLKAPKVVSPTSLASLSATYTEAHAGGILLGTQDAEECQSIRHLIWGMAKVPPLTTQAQDSAYFAQAGYPPLPALGRMNVDTGWAQLGQHWAVDANLRGVQVLLTAAGSLPPAPGGNHWQFQGNEPARVSAQMGMLLGQLARRRVALCSSPVPDAAGCGAPLPDLAVRQFRPLRDAVGRPNLCLQASNALLTAVDSLRPLTFSRAAVAVGLREGLEYGGLVFSADLSTTRATSAEAGRQEAEQDPAVMALLAGCDVLVNPRDPIQAQKNIAYLLRAGMISPAALDAKVRKVLWLKSWTHTMASAPPHPDSLRLAEASTLHEAALRQMRERTLTLLGQKNNLLPLRLAEVRKVATLTVGASSGAALPFTQAIAQHITAQHHSLAANVDSAAFSTKLNALLRASDDLVIALHPTLRQPDGSLPTWMRRALLSAQKRERLAVVSFMGEASLPALDSLHSLLLADGADALTQELAGQAVMGAFTVDGSLAFGSGRWPVGSGWNTGRPIRMQHCLPEEAGFPTGSLMAIDSILYEALRMEAFPGCQVLVAKGNKVVHHRAYGFHSYDRQQRVRLDDLYDIASVTKVASTTLMMMYAADRDTHLLNATLREYIADLDTSPNRLADITIDDLLVHQSGLPAAPPIDTLIRVMRNPALREVVYSRKPDSLHTVELGSNLYLNPAWLDTLWTYCKRRTVPAERGNYLYSDYNFFMLMHLLEAKFGRRLDSLVMDSLYKPLGLTHTGYLPLHRFSADQIVPTEEDKGWRMEVLDGHVHDETAALTGCVGGNAGLFSTSRELGVLLQTLLNGGSYGGRQIFSPDIVRRFTSRSPHCHRALGWDMQTNQPKNTMVCESATPACFGHIGYTGTAIWADPTHDIVFVFLSNRVHPTRNNWKINQYRIRQSLQQAVYEALGLYPPDPDCERASYLESNVEPADSGI